MLRRTSCDRYVGMGRVTRRAPTARMLARWRSAEWREAAQRGRARRLANRVSGPKCGAKAKSHGGPCRNAPLANGRCRCHGGRTPSGDQWHKITHTRRKGVKAPARADAKLKRRDRERRERQAKIAAMSAEERAAYLARQRSYTPGSKAERSRRRADKWFADLVSAMDWKASMDRKDDVDASTEGVFG